MPVTRVMLEYVHPWPNHAGLFLARHNGGFARAGLDVELISDGYDRGGAPAMLARGEAPNERYLSTAEPEAEPVFFLSFSGRVTFTIDTM